MTNAFIPLIYFFVQKQLDSEALCSANSSWRCCFKPPPGETNKLASGFYMSLCPWGSLLPRWWRSNLDRSPLFRAHGEERAPRFIRLCSDWCGESPAFIPVAPGCLGPLVSLQRGPVALLQDEGTPALMSQSVVLLGLRPPQAQPAGARPLLTSTPSEVPGTRALAASKGRGAGSGGLSLGSAGSLGGSARPRGAGQDRTFNAGASWTRTRTGRGACLVQGTKSLSTPLRMCSTLRAR